ARLRPVVELDPGHVVMAPLVAEFRGEHVVLGVVVEVEGQRRADGGDVDDVHGEVQVARDETYGGHLGAGPADHLVAGEAGGGGKGVPGEHGFRTFLSVEDADAGDAALAVRASEIWFRSLAGSAVAAGGAVGVQGARMHVVHHDPHSGSAHSVPVVGGFVL